MAGLVSPALCWSASTAHVAACLACILPPVGCMETLCSWSTQLRAAHWQLLCDRVPGVSRVLRCGPSSGMQIWQARRPHPGWQAVAP